MGMKEGFEKWTRKFYSDLACASDTWSDEKGTYTDYAHHMAWCLWRDMQSRIEELENEVQEQCRIIGMGAERELSLIAKIESLEKENAPLKQDAERARIAMDGISAFSQDQEISESQRDEIAKDWWNRKMSKFEI